MYPLLGSKKIVSGGFFCEEIFTELLSVVQIFHFQKCVELSFPERYLKPEGLHFYQQLWNVWSGKPYFFFLCAYFSFHAARSCESPHVWFQSPVSPLLILIGVGHKSQCRVSAWKCKPHCSIKMKIYPTFGINFLIRRVPQLYEYDDTNWHLESFLRFPGPKA